MKVYWRPGPGFLSAETCFSPHCGVLNFTVLICTALRCTTLPFFLLPVWDLTLLQRFTALHCVPPNCESRCRGTKLVTGSSLSIFCSAIVPVHVQVWIAQIALFWTSLRHLYKDPEKTYSTRNSIFGQIEKPKLLGTELLPTFQVEARLNNGPCNDSCLPRRNLGSQGQATV